MTSKIIINKALARHLIDKQFPEWSHLPIEPVKNSGWDNRTFHLGTEMLIRMPSAAEYEGQAEKEQMWLPKLAPHLPLSIPTPIALGKSEDAYPWKWSINLWLPGNPVATAEIDDLFQFAVQLAEFLKALQGVDAANGPVAGPQSFYRGGDIAVYDAETRQAIELLKNDIDASLATEIWEIALSSKWQAEPVWVHGDISVGNLLVNNGQLSAVIDFGQLAVGDPACDLAIAWVFFEGKSREVFFKTLNLDKATVARGRAWALWKALILVSGIATSSNTDKQAWLRVISEVMKDHQEQKPKAKDS
ncbi:TPA: aminoglycoside phosphotransferase family protein [Legionella pneumophila]|nr:aminoglycoside phosphotransferase family protein [Legionella pneumophila]HAT9986979.1 phosphotransferase [Legionella pneumophila subsp. pneumophila]HBP6862263.1 aminoglycoside phosphotransferase family protein [Legionella pneumophila]